MPNKTCTWLCAGSMLRQLADKDIKLKKQK